MIGVRVRHDTQRRLGRGLREYLSISRSIEDFTSLRIEVLEVFLSASLYLLLSCRVLSYVITHVTGHVTGHTTTGSTITTAC